MRPVAPGPSCAARTFGPECDKPCRLCTSPLELRRNSGPLVREATKPLLAAHCARHAGTHTMLHGPIEAFITGRRRGRDSWARLDGDRRPISKSGSPPPHPRLPEHGRSPLARETGPQEIRRRPFFHLVRLLRRTDPLTSHLRRQISGHFHACANFGDDRGIPAHDPTP
jgi:hypothetical protein